MIETTYLVIGGGIAGVSCVENLTLLAPNDSIVIVSASPLIKAATNVLSLTQSLQSFDVQEKSPDCLGSNVKFIHDDVIKLNHENKTLKTTIHEIQYAKLCICSGARPNLINNASSNGCVIGLRDTETVKNFQSRLSKARKVLIVGNGGIATELAWEIQSCEVVWAIKDSSIGSTFFDPGASEFFLKKINSAKQGSEPVLKRMKYELSFGDVASSAGGSALGPDWADKFNLFGQSNRNLKIEYSCSVKQILSKEEYIKSYDGKNENEDWPTWVCLTNGKIIGCDIVVSATGVVPNVEFVAQDGIELSEDGGIKVDSKMRTNIENVYAAGDVCSASWETSPTWFQMRLWTQARQMGNYAAKCMCADMKGEELQMDFCFELFTHVTKFFDYKVILLGLFNAKNLPKSEIEYLVRISQDREYVKVILQNGRMQGAVLIGETDLEETFENLILNQMDLSVYGENLLDPNIDIEDYFD